MSDATPERAFDIEQEFYIIASRYDSQMPNFVQGQEVATKLDSGEHNRHQAQPSVPEPISEQQSRLKRWLGNRNTYAAMTALLFGVGGPYVYDKLQNRNTYPGQ